jgi:hypothetical protein
MNKIVLVGVVIFIGVLIFVVIRQNRKLTNGTSVSNEGKKISTKGNFENKVIVQFDDDSVKKVNVASGETEEVSAWEKEDYTDFAGLPKLGDDKKQDIEQTSVILSQDKGQSIVTVTVYDSSVVLADNASPPILSTVDYLCDIAKKDCKKTELLTQQYQGLDSALQKDGNAFAWTAWDSTRNLLFGHLVSQEVGDVSPIYACRTTDKTCNKTLGYDSKKDGDQVAVVPNGAFSPSLEKFVMIVQHDKPNQETGKNWEMLMYASDDLSNPVRTYDLSAIIDRDENVAYDAVHSVAWSAEENKLVIGTTRRIFMIDVESGSLSLVYIAPTNAEGDFYWDSSRLFLSPDAKAAVFVDESDASDNSMVGDLNSNDVTINVLRKIDLENANKVTELMSGPGLSLK